MESSTHVVLTTGIVKGNGDECAARSQPVGFSSLCKCEHESGFSKGKLKALIPHSCLYLPIMKLLRVFCIWFGSSVMPPAVTS